MAFIIVGLIFFGIVAIAGWLMARADKDSEKAWRQSHEQYRIYH